MNRAPSGPRQKRKAQAPRPRTRKRRAVFLDRDGVLDRVILEEGRPHPPARLEEMELLPGVEEACARLKAAGYLLVCVTNQPDVARGIVSRGQVERINDYLRERLHLDEVMTCYHDDGDGCTCRKPEPGMILEAAGKLQIRLEGSFMVGDRWRDVEAGLRAGVRALLVEAEYAEPLKREPEARVASLAEAADYILDHGAESAK